jgi:tetratricopeptide (TPR) repeat protein
MYFEAIVLRDEEKNEESIVVLEVLLEENPDHADARQILAFWLQADKKFQEANEHFAVLKGSDDRRRSLAAQYQLARSRILGEFDQGKAVELLLDYLQQSPERVQGVPSSSSAHWRLGNAYEQLGQIEKARQAYTEALSLDGDNKEAKKALKNLPRR